MAQVLTLVCEGATSARKQGRFSGEDAVTASSLRQAEALRGLFGERDDVSRAPQMASRQTAEAMALHGTVDPRLRELDYGRWTGRRLRDVAAEEPERFQAWMGGAAPPGGEAIADLLARVDDWLGAQLRRTGRALVVASPNVVRAAVIITLGGPLEAISRLDILPLSISEFTSDGRCWRLRSVSAEPSRSVS